MHKNSLNLVGFHGFGSEREKKYNKIEIAKKDFKFLYLITNEGINLSIEPKTIFQHKRLLRNKRILQ